MKQLPVKNYTGGLQPFTANRTWADAGTSQDSNFVKDIDEETWDAGIGDDQVAKCDVSIKDMNGFLADCCLRSCLEELGYFPGTYFLEAEDTWLQMYQIPFKCTFPIICSNGSIEYGSVPVPTRWHRDCLMPKYSQNQTDSPLGFKITMSALPSPGTAGMITGSDIVCPSAGWLVIDTKIVADEDVDLRNSMQIWLTVSNSENPDASDTPKVFGESQNSVDFLIFDNGFPVTNMIPVSKGARLGLFASVAQNVVFDDIYFNLRLLSPEDVSEWS